MSSIGRGRAEVEGRIMTDLLVSQDDYEAFLARSRHVKTFAERDDRTGVALTAAYVRQLLEASRNRKSARPKPAPFVILPVEYDRLQAAGVDMRDYVRSERVPT